MAEILVGVEGKFILSINDHPEMRKVFKGFKVKQTKLKYSVTKGLFKEAKELLVINFWVLKLF